MKLFWGLIETEHTHTFDSNKWKNTASYDITTVPANKYSIVSTCSRGSVEYYQNTCLVCGELVEKKFDRTNF